MSDPSILFFSVLNRDLHYLKLRNKNEFCRPAPSVPLPHLRLRDGPSEHAAALLHPTLLSVAEGVPQGK